MKRPPILRTLTFTGWLVAALLILIVGALLWAAASHTGFPT
jgi:hypothetical protein